MKLDLTPAPVLGELIEDLENRLNSKRAELVEVGEYASAETCGQIEYEVDLLESILGRVVAQQELIDLKTNSINLN